ncbi:MAG: Nif3-like dinuclear metal center hexameric protein [Candidatus Rifleibacteriota bacterium]
MVSRNELVKYIGEIFAEVNFPDYSYNGLQFEGKAEVKKLVAAVDGTIESFTEAARKKGDFLLVHHGIFWKGAEWTKLDRINQKIFNALAKADLNLFALHLPLDAHPVYGNNALIAKALGAKVVSPFGGCRNPVGVLAHFAKPVKVNALKKKIEKEIGPVITHLDFGGKDVKSVGIVSGGGWSSVTDPLVYDGEVDLILTGEIIHQGVAACRDRQIHMISAGHYATEVFGVKELGKHLAEKFKLEFEFVDLPTGL